MTIFLLLILIISLIIFLKYLDFTGNPKKFWSKKSSNQDQIVLNKEEIEKFNKEILQNREGIIFNLCEYPDKITKEYLLSIIEKKDTYENIVKKKEYNLENLPEKIEVEYAVNISKSNLRVIPTNEHVFEDENDTHFDQLQEKEVKFGEPVIILHYNTKKNWVFIQTYNISGWIEVSNLAFTTKKEFLKYCTMKDFIVVTSRQEKIEGNLLDMSVKLEISEEKDYDYIVKFPIKNNENNLDFKEVKIEKNNNFTKGFKEYTRYNVIKQALKYLNVPYGWGGLYNGIDCSGFVNNIYSVFGFEMPRNSADQQALAGKNFIFADEEKTEEKDKILNEMPIGSLLYMKGHIMIYIGDFFGKKYVIHALGSKYDKSGNKIKVMSTVITSIDIYKKDKTFKDWIKSITYMSF